MMLTGQAQTVWLGHLQKLCGELQKLSRITEYERVHMNVTSIESHTGYRSSNHFHKAENPSLEMEDK